MPVTMRRKSLLKVLIGIVLVVVAAFVTTAIHDGIAMQNPENSLPTMSVLYGDETEEMERLPEYNVRRDSFRWKFMFGTAEWVSRDLEVWREVQPGWVQPEAELALQFSFNPESVSVEMAGYDGVFYPQTQPMIAPDVPGEYTYKVTASWGEERDVVYYFRIRIPEW